MKLYIRNLFIAGRKSRTRAASLYLGHKRLRTGAVYEGSRIVFRSRA